MKFENQPDKASRFIDMAVERDMLSATQAAELLQPSIERSTAPKILAMETELLDPVQIDILEVMLDPTNVAPGFEVLDVVGHGGLGVVYRATQTQLNRIVALKTIPISKMSGSGVVARFQQEAFAVGRLQHPNIVAAHDFGTHGERIYLAMELIEGEDVESLIQDSGPISESMGWALARQVAAGLAHAQELGIVHRDIKPANLLLTKPPAGFAMAENVPLVKITDFGLAKLAVEQGGKIKCGGARHKFSNEGYYFPPTIIECDNHNLPTAENELFGPVLSVMKFKTEDEVIKKMNDNQYGLSSGVYTSDLARGLRVSNAIRAGITFVNTYRLISPSAPFGGIKDSGYGKEAGIDSIKDYTRVKTTWYYTSDEPTLDPFSIR